MQANKWGMHAGKPNGVQKVWLDGALVYERKDILYTNTGKHGIDQLKFENFHGGKSDGFRPNRDQSMWCVSRDSAWKQKMSQGHCLVWHVALKPSPMLLLLLPLVIGPAQ
jgi:hypothetical protein